MNHNTLTWIIGGLFLLIVGAYSFTWTVRVDAQGEVAASESRLERRIDRLEENLLRQLERLIEAQRK